MADPTGLGQLSRRRQPYGGQVRVHRQPSWQPPSVHPGPRRKRGRDTPWPWSRPRPRFSPDGKQLAIIHGSGDSPHDIWVYDLKARTLKQITYSLVGGLNQDNFVQPHLVVYPAQDQTPISSFLYIPANIKPDRSHPAIVYPHGGPQWQHYNSWYPNIQYLTSHGYLVIAPNYRGSTGFGREYMESLRKDAGRGDLNDLVAATEYLKTTGYVDPKKIAIMGGSWGGYITLMALTKSLEIWAAGVSSDPLADWFT